MKKQLLLFILTGISIATFRGESNAQSMLTDSDNSYQHVIHDADINTVNASVMPQQKNYSPPFNCAALAHSQPTVTDDNICAGENATVTASANFGLTLNWYDAPSGGNLLYTGAVYSHSPVNSFICWVEETNSLCSSARSQVKIQVKKILTPPIAIDDMTCSNSSLTLGTSSSSGAPSPVFKWYDSYTNGTLLHTGNSYSIPPANQNYWVEEANSISAGNSMDNGPDVGAYSGMSRGYVFTSPANFTLTGLRVPTDQSTHHQSIEVIKFNNGTLPSFPSASNNFTSLFRATNVSGSGIISCNININYGDKIAIIGSRGVNCVNSYSTPNYQTKIAGIPVTLQRCGMQGNIASSHANNIWKDINNPIGRIEMFYDASFGCTSTRTEVKANVSEPAYSATNTTVTTNGNCSKNEGGTDWTYYYDNSNPENLIFAIAHDPLHLGNNNFTASVEITTSSNPDNPSDFSDGIFRNEDLINQYAYFAMGRYWNVTYSGTLTDPVDIRFFYNQSEMSAIETAADNWKNSSYNGVNNLLKGDIEWFSTKNSFYSPTTVLKPDSLTNSTIFSPYSVNNSTTANGINFVQLNGILNLSGGTAAISVFPGHLLGTDLSVFTAKNINNKEVLLSWTTESEENLEYFEIQRGRDGYNFKTIATVDKAGQNISGSDYSFYDKEIMKGENYYRIKMIEKDNKYNYSKTKVIVFLQKPGRLQIFPNPFDSEIEIIYESDISQTTKITLTDIAGKYIYETIYEMHKGTNRIKITPGDKITEGTYIINIKNNSYCSYKKMVHK
jgi:hypothetical protein